MEDLFDFLTQSAFQEINEHNQTASTKHVRKSHPAHGKLRDISSLNLRERLIHLLALKPLNKLELNERLQKDGIRKPEESLIGNVLAEVAQLHNAEYSLKHCMWNEVKTNWPYYTDQERQQLKLRKTQSLLNPTGSDEVTSTPIIPLRISASIPIQEEAVNEICGKRSCLEYDEPQIKKKRRTSHVSVGSSNNIHSQLNIKNTTKKSPSNGAQPDHKQIQHKKPALQIAFKGASNNTAKKSQHQKPTRQKVHKVSSDVTRKKISEKEPVNKTASEVAVTDTYKNKQRQESVPEIDYKTQKKSLEPVNTKTASEVRVTDVYKNNKRQESVPQVASKVSVNDTNKNDKHQKQVFQTNSVVSGGDIYNSHQHRKPVLQTTTTEHPVIEKKLIPDYDFSLYSTVKSIEQRSEYKCDFERIYEEYFRLRQRVEEVRYIFRVLPEQLKNVPEGSSEYQRIANRIFAEYERLNSKEEIELKRRFDYLEAKLIHIKQRVDDFDQKLAKESAVQAALAAYSQR